MADKKRDKTELEQSSSGSSPVKPGSNVRYESPTWWDRNRMTVYEMLKIFQICVCLFFIIVGIIMCFYNIFTSHAGDEEWFSWPWRKPDQYRNKKGEKFSIYKADLWYTYLFFGLWQIVLISICGLIGAAGEMLWCQIVYAIFVTLTISLFVYCPVPWLIVCGIIQEWGKPFYFHYYPVNV